MTPRPLLEASARLPVAIAVERIREARLRREAIEADSKAKAKADRAATRNAGDASVT